jgi:hypothetical protein
MVSITLSVPEEMKKEMDKFPEINWSEIARQTIQKRLGMLKQFQEFTRDSTLTQEDALRLGKEVNKSLTKRYPSKK